MDCRHFLTSLGGVIFTLGSYNQVHGHLAVLWSTCAKHGLLTHTDMQELSQVFNLATSYVWVWLRQKRLDETWVWLKTVLEWFLPAHWVPMKLRVGEQTVFSMNWFRFTERHWIGTLWRKNFGWWRILKCPVSQSALWFEFYIPTQMSLGLL